MDGSNISEIKSSLLKAISDHLDNMERGVSAARRMNDADMYTRTGPGDTYSRTTSLVAAKGVD